MASGEGRRQTDVPRILKVRINFEKVPAFTNSNNIFPGNPENRWRAAMPLLLHLLPQPPLQLLQTFGGEEHGKGKQFVCCSQIKHCVHFLLINSGIFPKRRPWQPDRGHDPGRPGDRPRPELLHHHQHRRRHGGLGGPRSQVREDRRKIKGGKNLLLFV